MCQEKRNPAVVAGLLGVVAFSAPHVALGATQASVIDSPVIPFALGCVSGAAFAGAVGIIVSRIAHSHERSNEELFDFPAAAGVAANAKEDATSDLAAEEPTVVSNTNVTKPSAGQSSLVDLPSVNLPAPASAGVTSSARATRNLGARIPEVNVDAPRAASVSRPSAAGATRAAEAPAVVQAQGPAHATNDYGKIAENYVRRQTFKERMASRARGVAEVLSERLGGDRFEGLPIIERADGTVGDVGTGWWNARLGDSVLRVGEVSPTATMGDLTIPDWMGDVSSESVARSAFAQAPVSEEAAKRQAQARSVRIAQAVAPVNQGVYPEKRSVDELDHDDVWESALQAMGERIAQYSSAPVFEDVIGGVDTIDEPDNLEEATSFIPFRTPAGHPEVVDTASYVDYLISEEFSRSSSKAVRTSSRRYLRLIRGGSQSLKSTVTLRRMGSHRSSHSEKAYVPRHMAVPDAAQEA